jgi:tRNA modification GTPase
VKSGDAIAAIATAPGRAGIGVIRISGPGEFVSSLALRLTNRKLQPRAAEFAAFADADGRTIDSGLAILFEAPHSYTGEQVLELQAHGSPVILKLLLARCVELGCRLAEPGEFTRRAYLNHKLDLAQAEAVADLIDAATAAAARSAQRSLAGEFSVEVNAIVAELVALRMLAEANIDFPEEGVDFLAGANFENRFHALQARFVRLAMRTMRGAILRRGLTVVLAGQPNVGKSSLLNRLAGCDRAIVTAIPGTTRDAIRESLDLDGIPVNIIDTAGLREAQDEVERIGVARTWSEIANADAVILMIDARTGMTAADRDILARLPERRRRILLYNKIDLAGLASRRALPTEAQANVALYISAKENIGIDLVRDELKGICGWDDAAEDSFMARERHLDAIARARDAMDRAEAELDASELVAEELRLAQVALNEITGEFTADDLLGEIFSRFCIGK